MTSKLIQPDPTGSPVDKAWLTPKQRAFCEALLADPDFSFTEAAKKAGYGAPAKAACILAKNSHIQKYVGHILHKRMEEMGFEVTAKRVLQELAAVGLFNPKSLYDKSGRLIPIHKLPNEISVNIRKVIVKRVKTKDKDGDGPAEYEDQIDSYEVWDKLSALEMLAKHVGLLKEIAPQMNFVTINWGDLLVRPSDPDPIEAKIESAKAITYVDPKEKGPAIAGNGQKNGHA